MKSAIERRIPWSALAACALAAACSSSPRLGGDVIPDGIDEATGDVEAFDVPDAADGDDPGDAGEGEEEGQGIGAREFCARYAAAACAYFDDCCTPGEKEVILGPGACGDLATADCRERFAASIDGARTVVDPQKLADLEETLRGIARSCPLPGFHPLTREYNYRALVEGALAGTLGEGAYCDEDVECGEGLFCFSPSCQRTTDLGGICREGAECGPGRVCTRGRCEEPRAEGGRCGDAEECALGLSCPEGHCRAMLPENAPCDGTADACEGMCWPGEPTLCRDVCNGV